MLRSVLEIRADADALVGAPLATGLRGAREPAPPAVWRARFRDDDGRVWRSEAATAGALGDAWQPAKPSATGGPALRSLRPLRIELRAELADGRSASRTVVRRLLGEGVQVRRWRGEHATLYLPAEGSNEALLVDATDCDERWPASAAALVASTRGTLVLVAHPRAKIEALDERLGSLTPGRRRLVRPVAVLLEELAGSGLALALHVPGPAEPEEPVEEEDAEPAAEHRGEAPERDLVGPIHKQDQEADGDDPERQQVADGEHCPPG